MSINVPAYIRVPLKLTEPVRLLVHAKPGAKISQIVGKDEALEIQINARAVEGAANEELVDFLSESLGIKKRFITIESGDKSRHKVVAVSGFSVQEIVSKIDLLYT